MLRCRYFQFLIFLRLDSFLINSYSSIMSKEIRIFKFQISIYVRENAWNSRSIILYEIKHWNVNSNLRPEALRFILWRVISIIAIPKINAANIWSCIDCSLYIITFSAFPKVLNLVDLILLSLFKNFCDVFQFHIDSMLKGISEIIFIKFQNWIQVMNTSIQRSLFRI